MATVTRVVAQYQNKSVRVEYDYDDAFTPHRLVAFRCVNNSLRPAWAKLIRQADGASRSLVIPAGATRVVSIPQSPASARFTITPLGGDKFAGVEVASGWPAD